MNAFKKKKNSIEKVFDLMDKLEVNAAMVNAWAGAKDAIQMSEDDPEMGTPHEVVDGNLDANLDDPEWFRIEADDIHEALEAMGIPQK